MTAELWDGDGRPLENMPLVSGAIVFDYGRRENRIHPDKALGRTALSAAREDLFPWARGGRALRRLWGRPWLGVLGALRLGRGLCPIRPDKGGRLLRGQRPRGRRRTRRPGRAWQPGPATGEREHPFEGLRRRVASGEPVDPDRGNTTLTVVIPNRRLERSSLAQFGRQVHSSMARAIQPFHTPMYGDVLYATSTGEVDDPRLGPAELGMLAS